MTKSGKRQNAYGKSFILQYLQNSYAVGAIFID